MAQYQVLTTTIGAEKIANAPSSGNVQLYSFQVGDANLPPNTSTTVTSSQTGLVNPIFSSAITNVYTINSSTIYIDGYIPATSGGFWMNEAGVFDQDNDLIFIANIPPTYQTQAIDGICNDTIVRFEATVINNTYLDNAVATSARVAVKDCLLRGDIIPLNASIGLNAVLDIGTHPISSMFEPDSPYAKLSSTAIDSTVALHTDYTDIANLALSAANVPSATMVSSAGFSTTASSAGFTEECLVANFAFQTDGAMIVETVGESTLSDRSDVIISSFANYSTSAMTADFARLLPETLLNANYAEEAIPFMTYDGELTYGCNYNYSSNVGVATNTNKVVYSDIANISSSASSIYSLSSNEPSVVLVGDNTSLPISATGNFYSNASATFAVVCYLPKAIIGLSYSFINDNANTPAISMGVKPVLGDKILYNEYGVLGTQFVNKGVITLNKRGVSFTVQSIDYSTWVILDDVGLEGRMQQDISLVMGDIWTNKKAPSTNSEFFETFGLNGNTYSFIGANLLSYSKLLDEWELKYTDNTLLGARETRFWQHTDKAYGTGATNFLYEYNEATNSFVTKSENTGFSYWFSDGDSTGNDMLSIGETTINNVSISRFDDITSTNVSILTPTLSGKHAAQLANVANSLYVLEGWLEQTDNIAKNTGVLYEFTQAGVITRASIPSSNPTYGVQSPVHGLSNFTANDYVFVIYSNNNGGIAPYTNMRYNRTNNSYVAQANVVSSDVSKPFINNGGYSFNEGCAIAAHTTPSAGATWQYS